MDYATKESAFFSGAKLLAILLELLLLFFSLFPDDAVSPKFMTAVILAVMSSSVSAFIGLIDDDVFVRFRAWSKWMRRMAAAALILTCALLVVSVCLIYLVNASSYVAGAWGVVAFLLFVGFIPRVVVYGFMFAEDIMGIDVPRSGGRDSMSDMLREFGGR